MRFCKLASNLHTNPKVVAAGRDARDVFVFLLCKNAELECDGRIPPRYAKPSYISPFVGVAPEHVGVALHNLVSEELVDIDIDGAVSFIGWDDEWRPSASNTERSRAFRARKVAKSNKRATECNVAATQTQRTETLGNGCNAVEESREEEKRVEETRGEEKDRDVSAQAQTPAPVQRKRRLPGVSGMTDDEKATVVAVLERLSERSGRKYRPTTDQHALRVLRLLRKGYSERDMRLVIWGRSEKWSGDPKMDEYLRPATLFGVEKFADYLAEAEAAWEAEERTDEAKARPRGELPAFLREVSNGQG